MLYIYIKICIILPKSNFKEVVFKLWTKRYLRCINVSMYMVHGTDVDSQLAKDIASLGLGFSQGRHVKI